MLWQCWWMLVDVVLCTVRPLSGTLFCTHFDTCVDTCVVSVFVFVVGCSCCFLQAQTRIKLFRTLATCLRTSRCPSTGTLIWTPRNQVRG
jgi:hypothetical protein